MLDRRTLSGIMLGTVWVSSVYLAHLANITFVGPAGIIPIAMSMLATLLLYLKHRKHRLWAGIILSVVWFLALLLQDWFRDTYLYDESGSTWLLSFLITALAFLYPYEVSPQETPAVQHGENKRKRKPQTEDEKMRLLLELMDEDERIAFKETLKERMYARFDHFDDGEIDFDGLMGQSVDDVNGASHLRT